MERIEEFQREINFLKKEIQTLERDLGFKKALLEQRKETLWQLSVAENPLLLEDECVGCNIAQSAIKCRFCGRKLCYSCSDSQDDFDGSAFYLCAGGWCIGNSTWK